LLCVFVCACGFHLRGEVKLPFDTLYLDTEESRGYGFEVELARAIRAGSNVRLTENPDDAQATLKVLSENREKRILALSGGGKVREFQLIYRINFRLSDSQKNDLIPTSQIEIKRDFPFNDDELLAREHEEDRIYRDMQSDAVQQIMWRLSTVKTI
jgi:LPS-assembly lipoprotein